MTLRRFLFGVGLTLIGVAAAYAGDEPRVAIKGYDPVAYFTDGRPVPGIPDLAYDWDGARWLFASAEHRELFRASPDRYAPQYDGFCALGMAFGEQVEIDPTQWTIVEGKLYLSSGLQATASWRESPQQYIATADENFAKLGR